ncbi:MAG: protein phosphatase 2C domain-containing protein [Butyrivibrio sp.]|nr:protein phosphatase 2C domain-containing protein [Butyrivibrio sp.]
MKVLACKYTDKGGRKKNEDSVGISKNIYVVADGLGGHSCGEKASAMAVDYILDNYSGLTDIGNDVMHNIISDVNMHIWNEKQNDPSYGNMASTVVAVFASGGLLNYLNVGDSRFYFFRNNELVVQSRDHSMTQMSVDLGEITPDCMRFHEDRSRLTKVLGLNETLRIVERFEPVAAEAGDAFLMCTDGFWEYIDERRMQKLLRRSKTPRQWMDSMVRYISRHVKGSNDNLSAICAMIR